MRALYTPAGYHLHAPLPHNTEPQAGLLPATVGAPAWLHGMQHPRDCRKSKFVVAFGWNGGVGAAVHVVSYHMGLANAIGRVLVFGVNTTQEFWDPVTCGPGVPRWDGWSCHFRPISSCTFDHAMADRDTIVLKEMEAPKGVGMDAMWWDPAQIPPPLRALYDKARPGGLHDEALYWYRGQAAAYLMRFNDEAVADLAALRHRARNEAARYFPSDPTKHPPASVAVAAADAHAPHLPRGTLSVHVRHGDKHQEMTLRPWSAYWSAAQALLLAQPFSLHPRMFVSTEDPSIFTELQEGVGKSVAEAPALGGVGWSAVWTDLPRNGDGGAMELELLMKARHPPGHVIRLHLLQLLMALEADAWVGTRSSNWCRLIEELRCVWVPKCLQPVVDLTVGIAGDEGPRFGF